MRIPGKRKDYDFEGCDCTCYRGEELRTKAQKRDDFDGYFVRGVPDFWQFDFGCTFNGKPNAVGCGPIAMAEILYWYGSRGYPELVSDHVASSALPRSFYDDLVEELADDGIPEPDTIHLWQSLVRNVRSSYVEGTGGWCGNGMYGMVQAGFMKLEDYAADHGVDLKVTAHKIKDKNSNEGLEIIKNELKAGRPLVMRFNSKSALTSFFNSTDTGENIFSGKLSSSSKYNDHYAVITGYRKTSTGRHVLYLNAGQGHTPLSGVEFVTGFSTEPPFLRETTEVSLPGTDTPVEWNPAGKWVRLYTIRVSSKPTSEPTCEVTVGNHRESLPDPRYFPDVDADTEGTVQTGALPWQKSGTGTFGRTVGFSHELRPSTYTHFSSEVEDLEDCGSVEDFLEFYKPVWETEELTCPNQAEPGELERGSDPASVRDQLGH